MGTNRNPRKGRKAQLFESIIVDYDPANKSRSQRGILGPNPAAAPCNPVTSVASAGGQVVPLAGRGSPAEPRAAVALRGSADREMECGNGGNFDLGLRGRSDEKSGYNKCFARKGGISWGSSRERGPRGGNLKVRLRIGQVKGAAEVQVVAPRSHGNNDEGDGSRWENNPFSKYRYVKTGVSPRLPLLRTLKEALGDLKPVSEAGCGEKESQLQVGSSADEKGSRSVTGGGPSLVLNPPLEERDTNTSSVPSVSTNAPPDDRGMIDGKASNSAFPANIYDIINAFSAKSDRRFEKVDILEIAAMKGIHFPPPRWWRPAGYGPGTKEMDDETIENDESIEQDNPNQS